MVFHAGTTSNFDRRNDARCWSPANANIIYSVIYFIEWEKIKQVTNSMSSNKYNKKKS